LFFVSLLEVLEFTAFLRLPWFPHFPSQLAIFDN